MITMNNNRLCVLICVALLFLIHRSFGAIFPCDPNASCGCSILSTSITARIVGGEEAQNNAWGWAIQILKSRSLICTGVLVMREYAITAAHCVSDGTTPSELSIIAGTNILYDTNAPAQQRQVTEFFIHPDYNAKTGVNDIAVLRFPALTGSENSTVRFICFPSPNVDPFTDGSDVVAVGWGYTFEGANSPSPVLRQVTVQVISSSSADCRRVPIVDTRVQLCAGVAGGGKDTCQGDSGGPLMVFTDNKWVLAAVTSRGVGCARPGFPGLYTRVSVFISFIQNVMNTGSVPTTVRTSTVRNTANLGDFSFKLIFLLILSLLI